MTETAPVTASSEPASRPSALAWLGVVLLVAIFGLSIWYYPPLTDASAPIETPSWVKFLGRFHVVALHLPVGVLALAAIMELFVCLKLRSAQFLAPATTFTLMVGAAGSVVAVVFGIFLARKGGFGFAEFYAHQALGIATAAGALLTLVLKLSADASRVFSWPYRMVFGLTLVVMAVGAHFGGNMVHESDYLTKYAPAPVRVGMERFEHFVLAYFEPEKRGTEVAHDPPPIKAGSQAAIVQRSRTATVYAALVAPILADRCTSCHDSEKSKADLRLDTHEFIMKGSTNGEVVVVGQPDKSRLIECMVLPPDDDDHMPPPKKPQPTAEEIALLKWWIKEGASKSLTVSKARVPEELKLFVKAQMARTKTGSTGGTPPLMLALAESAAKGDPKADPVVAEAMKKINGSGASLAPVAADARELRFTALNVAKDYTDASLKDLEPVAGKIVALDLAKTKITDNALASIAKMTTLRELHLENTAVTDAGAAQLKSLANLEYLNLYGTKVTDKTLVELDGLAKLKALYLWQSGVTKAGVDAFKAKHPAAVVNAGWTEADNAKVVAVAATKPAPAAPAPAKTAAPAAPKSTPAKAAAAKAPDPNALVYKDIVAPIIEAKCAACHGKEKSKGKLRMHTFADLMKGGSDGATTVVAGKAAESLMITRTLLPLDDDDHMPPKDEKQATKEELAILKWWIEQGASESLTLANAKKTPEIEGALKALATTVRPAQGAAPAKESAQKPKAKPLTPEEKKAVAEAAAKMTALNASLMAVALDTEQLRFGCINAADKFGDKELGELVPVAPLIVWVDLGRSKVTDAGLATLAKMANLERLHLENTAVTDAGIAQLAGLTRLEYLNLYGTKVTDAGIAKLSGIKTLRKVFFWQTGVTKEAAKKLEAAIPGLVANVGLSESEIAKLVEETKVPEPPKPVEKKPDAKAAKPEVKPAAPPAKPEAKAAKTAKPDAPPATPNNPPAPPVKPGNK